MSVGSYVRAARERQRLTLEEVSRRTKISAILLADLEENDLRRWPKAYIYRKGHLEAYALAIGLDPAKLLARFDDEFGDPNPVAFHGAPRKPARPLPFGLVRYAVLLVSVIIVTGGAATVFKPLHKGRPAAIQESASKSPIPAEPARPANANNIESDRAVASAAAQPAAFIAPTPEADESEIEGELRITSDPPNAHVTVNGNGYGPTPIRVRYLPLGSYRIRVIETGYQIAETEVTLKRDQPVRSVRMVLRNAPQLASSTADRSTDLLPNR